MKISKAKRVNDLKNMKNALTTRAKETGLSFMNEWAYSGNISKDCAFTITHKKDVDCKIFSNAALSTLMAALEHFNCYGYININRDGNLEFRVHN